MGSVEIMSYIQQVGGDHYNGEYQHWDMVIDTNMHYLLGCATKYLCRYKTDRYQDLEKAHSFVAKAENHLVKGVHQEDMASVHLWLSGADLPPDVENAIEHIAYAEYGNAKRAIEQLMEEVAMAEMAGYVDQD